MNELRNSPGRSLHPLTPRRGRRFGLGLVALTGLLVTACAVGPDFERPENQAVQSYTRADAQQADGVPGTSTTATGISDQWWTVYQSDRINQLVERALAHNPNIDSGLANLRQAQEYVTAQRGFFYPQVQAGYSVSRQGSGQVLSSPLVSGDTVYTLHTAQVNVGFVPDVFGGNRRQVESLQATADSQQFQLDALRITIAANVVSAVIQEQYLIEQVALVEDASDAARELVRHTQMQFDRGYASQIDLAQQQAAYAQTVALVPPLRKQLELTRDLLAVLCGDLPQTQLPGAPGSGFHVPEALPRVLPSQLVAHRPDVRAAEESLHATHALIGVAVANMLPQLSLSAGVGYSGSTIDSLFTGPNQIWGLVGGITAPVFTAGTLSARKRAAEQAALAAQAQYKAVVLTAFQNVADTLYAIDADGKSVEAARLAEVSAGKVLKLTEQQFEGGYVSRPQLLAARQAWITATLSRVAAEASYLGDTAALYQALGGGWKEPA